MKTRSVEPLQESIVLLQSAEELSPKNASEHMGRWGVYNNVLPGKGNKRGLFVLFRFSTQPV